MDTKGRAGELLNARNYADAIPLYREVVEVDAADLNAWECLVMCLRDTESYDVGIDTAKTALKIHARSAWLWRELGQMLIKLDRLDEAHKSLDQAKRIEPGSEWLWRYFIKLHRARKHPAFEAEALEKLVDLGKASGTDLNKLGIVHHDNKNYGKALEYYRASAIMKTWTAPYYNMGLVYSDPEVSQDADAADAYRRALLIDAAYEKASVELTGTKAKLLPLAVQARTQAELLRRDDRYHHYLNPFEVLQLATEDEYDVVDPKAIHRAKKRLLHELELNDGRIGWLEDQLLDKSRVLAIDDELLDARKRAYHLAIARNKRLLRFLTHGDIEHFLYSDDYFPVDILELLDADAGFRAFLSKPFAAQYNTMLSRAIEKRTLAVVEVLFDGRRWVEDADLDQCLLSAFKKTGHLMDVLTELETESEVRLVGFPEVQNALEVHGMVGLFNLLPAQFRAQQTQLVACLRSLAVNCHNKHGQTEMSKSILLLCKKFQFKSHALNERLKEDYKKIEELLAEQLATPPQRATRTPSSHAPKAPKQNTIQPTIDSAKKEKNKTLQKVANAAIVFGILVLVGGIVCNRAPDIENDEKYVTGKAITDIEPLGILSLESNRTALYDALASRYDLGTFDEFNAKLDDPIKVKALYDGISSDGYDVGEFETFKSKFGPLETAWISVDPQKKPPFDPSKPIEIEAPDGTIIEFPSTMSESEITAIMRNMYPPPTNQPEGVDPKRIMAALRAADAAGDTEAARRLAQAYRDAVSSQAPAVPGKPSAWKPPADAKLVGQNPAAPGKPLAPPVAQLDDSWEATSYYNGEAPECFNYTPKYDRQSYEVKLDVVSTGYSRNNFNTDGISEAEFNK
ncbi:MAG: tetratricopeptide repeat protein [Flavobacteriales bacterium]|nr:tetratricopeptide repeat protein [Flavobacteriales bacterium]